MLPYNEPGPSSNTAYSQYPPTQHTTGHHSKPLSTAAYSAQQHTNYGRSKPVGSGLRMGAESHYKQQQQRGYLPKSSQQSHYSKHSHSQMQSSDLHQRRLDAMHSMRKHRSLDGSLFLSDYDNQPQSRIPPPPLYGTSDPHDAAFNLPHTSYDLKYGAAYDPQTHQRSAIYGQSGGQNYPMGYDDVSLPLQSSSKMSGGMNTYTEDVESLRQENMALNQKLNYMMNSIRSFWSPELKSERQQRKDESVRLAAFQDKVMQQASEIQTIRNELDRREKDIGQLLSDSDLLDMEDELRRLRKHLTPNSAQDQLHYQRSSSSSQPRQSLHQPRDYTEKNLSAHEIHTLKMKMERSELSLAEKQRELQNAELRLKGAEEQNNELEKRLEIVTRSNVANESQLKLLQDDLNILRSKLETRNQLVEGKEKTIKILEKDVDLLRQQLQESGQGIHNQDHRNAQLQIRVDQLETLLRERESEVDRLKQRLHQQPNTRIEQELQQRIENLETDNRKLLETVDAVRKSGDVEKQQQLQAFQDETRQLQTTIQNLQKELADRQILLASQNEKISQFDSQLKSAAEMSGCSGMNIGSVGSSGRPNVSVQTSSPMIMSTTSEKAKRAEHSTELLQRELEETRNEVGHLLQKIQALEKDKVTLQNKCTAAGYDRSGVLLDSKADSSSGLRTKGESSALKIRIEELEEALRESVGITAEREKQLNEQKLIIQQMSAQFADLYKDPTRRLKGTGKTDAEQKAWDEERQRYQRQLVNLRKEVTMAAIREKDSCIQLLQGPPDSLKEKIEILARQKEQLRHRLLTQNSESYSTTEGGPYLGNVWLAAQQPTGSELTNPAHLALNGPKSFGKTISGGQPLHRVQPPFSNYVHSGTGLIQNGIMAGAPTSQVSISIPPYGSVPSAPASFTYGTKIDATDDGIWA